MRNHSVRAGAAPLAHSGDPVLGAALISLGLGAALGLAFGDGAPREAIAGLLLVGLLAAAVLLLARNTAQPSRNSGERTYRAFFENAVEGIFRTSPDGRYLDANPALATMYGYSTPETMRAGLVDIAAQLYIDPDRREEFRRQMQANDQVTDFISEIRRRDGSRIWISENAHAVRDWNGALLCYEGTVEDVTARIETQRALGRAMRELEDANRAKSAFLAAMSHELKTPLNAVLGFSEMLSAEILGPLGHASYREYAHDIHASGQRLLAVVNDILDHARLQGGALTLSAQICDVNDVVHRAIAMARAKVKDGRPVKLVLERAVPHIDVDMGRFSQAIANVLSNAFKYTPEGGEISLRVGTDGGHCFAIVVEDTGIGMAPEKIAMAMEPFRQVDGSLARRFEGAGLGLAIAKSVVELHGGALSVESAVGKGTRVTITLPPSRLSVAGLAA